MDLVDFFGHPLSMAKTVVDVWIHVRMGRGSVMSASKSESRGSHGGGCGRGHDVGRGGSDVVPVLLPGLFQNGFLRVR